MPSFSFPSLHPNQRNTKCHYRDQPHPIFISAWQSGNFTFEHFIVCSQSFNFPISQVALNLQFYNILHSSLQFFNTVHFSSQKKSPARGHRALADTQNPPKRRKAGIKKMRNRILTISHSMKILKHPVDNVKHKNYFFTKSPASVRKPEALAPRPAPLLPAAGRF